MAQRSAGLAAVTRAALGLTLAALLVTAASSSASSVRRCGRAPHEGRLAVSVNPGPGCDGAAVLARKLWSRAEQRFPRALPRHSTVDTPSPPAGASPATFRFRCTVHSVIVQSRQAGHEVRVTTARCANQRGSRFRYSFTMA